MFDFKKLISPRAFLASLDPKKFSWQLGVLTFAALLMSVVVSALVFAGASPAGMLMSSLTPGYGFAITFFGAIAIIRVLFIRFLISLGIGYALSEFHADFKRSRVTMWQVVNAYFYAMLVLACTQMAIFIASGVLSVVVGSLLLKIAGFVFTSFFNIMAIGLAAYWVYQAYQDGLKTSDPVSHNAPSHQPVIEGEVVKHVADKNDKQSIS